MLSRIYISSHKSNTTEVNFQKRIHISIKKISHCEHLTKRIPGMNKLICFLNPQMKDFNLANYRHKTKKTRVNNMILLMNLGSHSLIPGT